MARLALLLALFAAALALDPAAAAQQAGPSAAPTATVDTRTLPPIGTGEAVHFDPRKATDAYLARICGPARARSDAYFEGGYVLLPVDALYAIAVSATLLWFRVSARIRDVAQRRARTPVLQVPIYVVLYILLTALIGLPLTLYEKYFREKAHGLMNQSFLAWFGDFALSTLLSVIGGAIVLTIVYAGIRRTGRSWWVWGAIIGIVFAVFDFTISPVFISPLFNHYSALPASPLKADIVRVARANGIPADDVYLVDASRQSDKISANVSGFLGTTRIALNDNLLKKGTHDEVLSVLGHEMGHYVFDHATRDILMFGALSFVGFAFAAWGFGILTARFGGAWQVRGIDDPAGLPVLAALATFFLFVATPVLNTITRTSEIQADMFGLNVVRKPDAFATVVLKVANYRKLDPSPWEEAIFYDHPSGRTRIWEAMRWKAGHLNDPDIKAGPVSPR